MQAVKTYIISILLFACIAVGAQEQGYLEQYSTEDGLSDNFVTAIMQDTRGYLWIGTQRGLSRFDGKYFKNFTIDRYPSLGRNDISCLNTDEHGRLLIGSHNSVLIRYNQAADTFDDLSITNIYGTDYASVTKFVINAERAMYALTTSGLYRYDDSTDRFSNDKPQLKSTEHLLVQDMYIDCLHRYWIGTSEGIHVLDSSGAELALFTVSKNSKSENFCLQEFNDSTLFIGTSAEGLWAVNTTQPINRTRLYRTGSPLTEVSCFLQSAGKCYIGTRSMGLWYVDQESRLSSPSFVRVATGIKAVNSMYLDQSGNLWFGTQGAGLYCYRKWTSGDVLLSRNTGFPQTIVSSFAKDGTGRLWVGTDGDGIYILKPDLHIDRHVIMQKGLSSNGILSIANGGDEMWAATWGGGICRIDQHNYKARAWTSDNSALPLNNNKSVFVAQNGTIWAGTHGEGLCKLDFPSGHWLSHRSGGPQEYALQPAPWVNQITEGPGGILWIATIRNVFRMEGSKLQTVLRDTGSLPMKNPLFVHAIAADNHGKTYAATNRGIYIISADGNYSEMPGEIPRGEYFSVLFDKQDRCWLIGDNGISYLDADNRSVHTITLPSERYRGNYFTPRAAYTDSDGQIFVGTVDGYLYFHPDSLSLGGAIDTIILSELYLSSERQAPGSDILPYHISCTQSIRIAYNQTNIRVAFDVINMDKPDNIHSAYLLAGIDTRWTNIGTEREVAFSHIPPGKYTLYIKAWQGTDESKAKTVSLTITVSPPWWKTWWFILITCSSILLLVIVSIRIRFNRILSQKQLLEAQVAERTQELLTAYQEIDGHNKTLNEHQFIIEMKNEELSRTLSTKDRLLSIIAHDLKNPMFTIVTLLETLQRRFDEYEHSKKQLLIGSVLDSARLLQSEMIQLLEWATLQHRDQIFVPQSTDINIIIRDCESLLRQTAEAKGIEILFEPITLPNILIDARMIATVIRNLINNAVKFTPQGGTVTIKTILYDDTLQISVADTGVGMTQKQLETLFAPDSFSSTRGTNSEKGTGLGLKICKEFVLKNSGTLSVDSIHGNGTTVTIALPAVVPHTVASHENTEEKEANGTEEGFALDLTLLEGNTVLIIDDNAAIRQRLSDIIGPYATVLEASDGEEGLCTAIKYQPDIILSDVDMPAMDGLNLCRKIADSEAVSHIPVVLVTAQSKQIHKLAGLQSGAVDYITKPFNEMELLMKLSNILAVRRRQQQKLLSQLHSPIQLQEEVHPFLARFLEVVEQNYRNADLSVEDLAHAMAMSKTTLWRRLSSIIDKTPNELLNEYRLRHAHKLLEERVFNVSEVAYEVGFSDPRYFSRRFKELFGISPSDV